MSLEIIKFEKSPETRLKEFVEILRSEERSMSVEDEWRSYIETVLEPTGWEAVWQVSRSQCEEFEITFPTVVFVEVINVNFNSLSATIRILAVQDDIDIPETFDVPLQELYPTLHQENNELNIEGTANCLEQYRFFYEHIWFPWDIDECVAKVWANKNLESRINLYRDMWSGGLLRQTAVHIRLLIEEARTIKKEMNDLRCEVRKYEEYLLNVEGTPELKAKARWIELQLRMKQIILEVESLENPAVRSVAIKLKETKAMGNIRRSSDGLKDVCLILLGGTIDELILNLTKAKTLVGESAQVKCFNQTQDALDQAFEGNTLLLCAGIHKVNHLSGLKTGGTVMGMSSPEVTILQAGDRTRILLDVAALDQDVKFENLTITNSTVQALLLVRCGTVYLNNCHLVGDAENKTQEGIQVLGRSKLMVKGCIFRNFGTAIVVGNGASVTLNECTAVGCGVGLKVLGKANVTMQKSCFTGCKEYGIIVETFTPTEQTESTKTGSIHILDSQAILIEESSVEGVKAAVMVSVKDPDKFTLFDECND